MKSWFAVDVRVQAAAAEAVESALDLTGAAGTAIDGLRKKLDEPLTVTGFFEEAVSLEDVEDAIAGEFAIHSIERDAVHSIDFREVANEDWLAEWKKHWQPTEAGKFVITPPWIEPDTDKIVIKIEPNMAFGTGTHETTRLCLEAISEHYRPGMSVLDVGTGTGILAIACAKLGGTKIFACDTDIDSVAIARENAFLNGVADVIEFRDAPIDDHTPQFDMVCANLTLDVIEPLLPLLIEKSRELLVMSGILVEQEGEIRRLLKTLGYEAPHIDHSGEWLSAKVYPSVVS
ncbi:MAG: 50S ribosomal protein L11 methyltransferase [Acidobacteria bacterium]|nr:50S ribosomal protein L11 methyltransferase [Acidobacteriota bacterium]